LYLINATRAKMLTVPTTTVPRITSCRRPRSSSTTRVAVEVGLVELDGVIEDVRVGDCDLDIVGVVECDGESDVVGDCDLESVGDSDSVEDSESVVVGEADSVGVSVALGDDENEGD
jgi:hypothetical protein